MMLWNWKLLFSSGVGLGVMVLVYSMYKWDLQQRWSELRKILDSTNSRLAASVFSGGVACVTTYMAVAIWSDSNSHWIAAGAIIQGLGTLLTLVLLIWQMTNLIGNRQEDQLDEWLVNLTESDPLKRLIAVRQITKFIHRTSTSESVLRSIADCLGFLLAREEEEVIRSATFEILQSLDVQNIQPNTQPNTQPNNKGVPLTPLPMKQKQRISQ
ncbi:MAG: hypothetical protein HC908_05025 [Calothrix sp. SM1_7_51]|nr:hypothetical protein [Calothrix sp. SM1_7_51]